MNSFRFLERGIAAELERQARACSTAASEVEQETLPLRPADGFADLAALEGVRARLPLLPRARPGSAGAHRGDADEAQARRCRSSRRGAASATWTELGLPEKQARPARLRRRARRVLRAARSAPPIGRRPAHGGQLGDRRARGRPARGRRRRGGPRSRRSRRRPWARLADMVGRAGDDAAPRARCWRPWSPREATRPRSSSARGSARWSDSGELEAIVEAAIEAEPDGRGEGPGRQPEGGRADRRRRDARDEGPRRRGRGHAADPRLSWACNSVLQAPAHRHTAGMAWNVVIAGGGFGGDVGGARARAPAPAAVRSPGPRQRRQLPALHAVPSRGGGGDSGAAPRRDAAARHPAAHLPAARRGDRPRPGDAHRSSSRPTRARTRAPVRPAVLVASARCRACCRSRARRNAIGFKSLADAIWLRNHVVETLEAANATEDPAAARSS